MQITNLSNGTKVVTHSVNDARTAAVGIWVPCGSRYEHTKSLGGISHFIEHMLFKGTKQRTALQLAKEIEDVGGYHNAYTSRHSTAYHARVLGEHLYGITDVLLDMLCNSIFDTNELNNEKFVVCQEISQSNDDPQDVVLNLIQSTIFPEQPIGRPILGTKENIMAFTGDNLRSYINKFYGQMVVCAYGCVDHESFLEAVNKHTLPSGAPLYEEAIFKSGTSFVKKDIEQTHVVFSFEAPCIKSKEYYTTKILSIMLGNGMSSPLFTEVREKRGLAYSIYSYYDYYMDIGTFNVYAGIDPSKINELKSTVLGELNSDKLQASDLARAKAAVKSSLFMRNESYHGSAEKIANDLMFHGRVIADQEIIESIEAIDMSDVQQLAQKIFSIEPSCAVVGPVQ